MNQYPEERRNAMIRKMLPPDCPSIAQLARDEGISKWTLYDWRKQAIDGAQRIPMPDKPA
ncbi:transposase, partial [Oceanimonas marisflavi]|uniref:transposase n=1 Tax=Oceanimonas marisflavi TaxID=2059724 RepID=UPI001300BC89